MQILQFSGRFFGCVPSLLLFIFLGRTLIVPLQEPLSKLIVFPKFPKKGYCFWGVGLSLSMVLSKIGKEKEQKKEKKGKEEGRKEEERKEEERKRKRRGKGQFEPYLNKSIYIYTLIYLCIFIFRRLRWHTTASMVCIAVCHL